MNEKAVIHRPRRRLGHRGLRCEGTDGLFLADTNYLPEIWATGLRNPWRFSFDSLTGDLLIADVGGTSREEIDFQPATGHGGQNYGWPIKEGSLGTNFPPGLDSNQLTASSEAQFYGPFGLCVATNGIVYLADTSNHVIRKITPVDWDGDSIPDALEGGDTPYVVGVDDRIIDSDADSMSNTAEFIAGTDPRNPDSRLFVEGASVQIDGSILLWWPSIAGKLYQVQSSLDLTAWNTVTNGIQGTGQSLTFSTLRSTNQVAHQFFRVGVQSN